MKCNFNCYVVFKYYIISLLYTVYSSLLSKTKFLGHKNTPTDMQQHNHVHIQHKTTK